MKINQISYSFIFYLCHWDYIWQALHHSCPLHLPYYFPMCRHPSHSCLLLYNPTMAHNKTYHLWDIRYRSTGHPFSSLPLWSNRPSGRPIHHLVIYIYIFCHHPTSHPSILAFPLSFFLVFYNGLLWVGRRIYVALYLWRREKNKGRFGWGGDIFVDILRSFSMFVVYDCGHHSSWHI